MRYKILESQIVFGDGITSLMEGVNAAIKDGWFAFGTPAPCNLTPTEYGMMQIMCREKSGV